MFIEYISGLDNSILNYLYSIRTDYWTKFFYGISTFGEVYFVSVITFLLGMFFLYKKQKLNFLVLWLAVAINEATVYFLKIIIARPRPSSLIAYYKENSFSFPSGHSSISVVLYGLIAFFIWNSVKSKSLRILFVALFSLLVILISFSRLYLGVHYFSDVVGAIIISSIWLLIAIFTFNHFKNKK